MTKKHSPSKAKTCKHKTISIVWHLETGQELTRRCSQTFGCGEQLSLGTAKGDPDAVELRAAQLVAGARSLKIERLGMMIHAIDCEGIVDDEPVIAHDQVGLDTGWLYREIRTHDGVDGEFTGHVFRDQRAWSWDITRPIADQELEIKHRLASGKPARIIEQLITEQTRHDVAASVARHTGLGRTDPDLEELLVIDECCFVDQGVCEELEHLMASTSLEVPALSESSNADLPGNTPTIALTATSYEAARKAEPDCRDEEGSVIAGLILEARWALETKTELPRYEPGPATISLNKPELDRVEVDLEIGEEPEQGVEFEISLLTSEIAHLSGDMADLLEMLYAASWHKDWSLIPAALDHLRRCLDNWHINSYNPILFEQLDPSRLVRLIGQTLLASTRSLVGQSAARQAFLSRFLDDLRIRGTPESTIVLLQKELECPPKSAESCMAVKGFTDANGEVTEIGDDKLHRDIVSIG